MVRGFMVLGMTALAVGAAAALAAPDAASADQVCGVADELASAQVSGEVYGSHGAEHRLSDKLVFALSPQEHGWRAEVRDVTGDDLAIMTPPLRVVETNPRMISGWHFRNAANTGPNQGDVNAPQSFRTILFGPGSLDASISHEAILPGGARGGGPFGDPGSAAAAANGAVGAAAPAVRPLHGRGEIQIDDMGLADLAPGQRARMVYMQYSACLEWSPLVGEVYVEANGPAFPDALRATLDACGFAGGYQLTNYVGFGRTGPGASWLELDVDADGAADTVAPIERTSDRKRGIAVCRGDGSLELLGFEGGYGEHLVAAYFDSIDWWGVHAAGPVGATPAEDGPPPASVGGGPSSAGVAPTGPAACTPHQSMLSK